MLVPKVRCSLGLRLGLGLGKMKKKRVGSAYVIACTDCYRPSSGPWTEKGLDVKEIFHLVRNH